jgi:hypothetical protein
MDEFEYYLEGIQQAEEVEIQAYQEKARIALCIENINTKSNIAYTLMLSDIFTWMLNRTTIQGTLKEMIIKNELNANDWLHFDIIPENNLTLRYQVPAPDLLQTGIEEAWKALLKEPEKYNVITPQRLLEPILFESKYRNLINYLNYRYW